MKEWELWKCFHAFNTIHGKLSTEKLPPPRKIAHYTKTVSQTLILKEGGNLLGANLPGEA